MASYLNITYPDPYHIQGFLIWMGGCSLMRPMRLMRWRCALCAPGNGDGVGDGELALALALAMAMAMAIANPGSCLGRHVVPREDFEQDGQW